MANRTRNNVSIFGAAAAFAVAMLMIAYPVIATATTFRNSPANPPAPVVGEQIILTSTSGYYKNFTATTAATSVGPASGTITLTVVATPVAGLFPFYDLKVTSGSVSLGTRTIAFTGGNALMNHFQWFVIGTGTVQGGTFNFVAASLSPTAIPIHPGDFNILSMQLYVGGHHYLVLLHVTTTIVTPTA